MVEGTHKGEVWEMDLFLESKDPNIPSTVQGRARAEEIAQWTPPPRMAGESGKIYWAFDGKAPQATAEADAAGVAQLTERLKAAMCDTLCKDNARLEALLKGLAAVQHAHAQTVVNGDQEWKNLYKDAKHEASRLKKARNSNPPERKFERDGRILDLGVCADGRGGFGGRKSGEGTGSRVMPRRLKFKGD